jgi:hypothetical protein
MDTDDTDFGKANRRGEPPKAQNQNLFTAENTEATEEGKALLLSHGKPGQANADEQERVKQRAEALALKLAQTYEELTRLLERNPGMKREITEGSTKEDKVYQKLKTEAEDGGHGPTLPMGEAGRNKLQVTADEAAHLLLCAHADGGGAGPDAEAATAGRR